MKTDKFLLSKDEVVPPALTLDTQSKNSTLWQAYLDKKAQTPMLFPTEGAAALGVTEFELMLASPDSVYLGQDCRGMLSKLEGLGMLESIVRNSYCVHEKMGIYKNLQLGKHTGLGLHDESGALDIRLFLGKWAHMLAVKDSTKPSHSIQFFDQQGNAINKAFLKDSNKLGDWQALCDQHQANAEAQATITPTAPQGDWIYHELSDEQRQSYQDDWLAMTDIHEFHGILQKYELDRPSAFCQAPEGSATKLAPEALEALFLTLADKGIAVMIFVGNTGLIQIHTDNIHNIKRLGDWLNILDDNETGFSLHLKDSAISQLWLIERPNGKYGVTHGIEAFDKRGNSILTLFGEREEEAAQCQKWQEVVKNLANQYRV